MEKTLENAVGELLTDVAEERKCFEAKWLQTGEKYNIFKVADIAHKEVIMCRVLADLLDPQGIHCQGSRYLSLFCEAISPKLPVRLELNVKDTKVTAEYVIDENRRIDITLEDGRIFVPIEVKIWATDQPRQVADYYEFAKKKNSAANKVCVNVPVLYLTVDGHEPLDFSKAGVGKDDYVLLSFRDDILAWLEACVRNTLEIKVPVRESLRQLIAAVKSLCGKSEDDEMEEAIFKLVTKDDDSVRAAMAISGCLDFGGKAKKEFIERIVPQVKKVFPKAEYLPNEEGWDFITIPLKGTAYSLDLNYDWKLVQIGVPEDEGERDKQLEKYMAQEMREWTNLPNKDGAVFLVYTNRYPMKSAGEDLYLYRLVKEYIERPQEVADRIISIARKLENVKV